MHYLFIHFIVDYIMQHDDVITWKHFPRYWPFVRGIHRFPVNSSHKGQWRGALIFSLICVWINDWVNNREAGDLRRHRGHYIWRHCNEIYEIEWYLGEGVVSIYMCCLTTIGISIINIKRSRDRLIFIIGIVVSGKLHLYWNRPRLNIKTVLSTYGDFHVKDKTAVRTSYL